MPPRAPAPEHARREYTPDEKSRRRGIGLCLSGGGYRAALFHLGTLRRLNEMGVLRHAEFRSVASVSGGSITAAVLATAIARHPDWSERFDQTVAEPLRAFTRRDIRTGAALRRLLPWNWFDRATAVHVLRKRYEELTPLKLSELPASPEFRILATDMAFGVLWRFERERAGSYRAGYLKPPPADWTLGRAVAASSCFPPVFNPMPVRREPEEWKESDAQREDPASWAKAIDDLRLTDGGNYDNMGLEPVWKDHAVVLVSDAGGLFSASGDEGLLWRVKRYQSIQEAQTRLLRKRWLIAGFLSEQMDGAYWGVGSARSSYDPDDTRGYSKALAKTTIACIRTDLDRFDGAEQAVLENHGYLLADKAVARHVELAGLDKGAPLRAPHPEWLPPQRDEDAIAKALEGSDKRKLLGRG